MAGDDESVSGAMGRGQAAGSEGAPLPRTDPADTGTGDGGMDAQTSHRAGGVGDGMRTGGSAGTASGQDPTPSEPAHVDGLTGNRGIAGGQAGGTGP